MIREVRRRIVEHLARRWDDDEPANVCAHFDRLGIIGPPRYRVTADAYYTARVPNGRIWRRPAGARVEAYRLGPAGVLVVYVMDYAKPLSFKRG